jgi:glycosyltransferase involved in cell wall biosynthesis
MNIVFIHPNFPGQFGYLAEASGKEKDNKTAFITLATANKEMQIPGVKKIIVADKKPEEPEGAKKKEGQQPQTSPALLVANGLMSLKKQDYVPDLIIGHSGPGTSFYVKDVFPETPFLSFFEWFHSPDKINDKFESAADPDLKIRMNLRNKNLSILSDLCACDHGICPTDWQKSQFPEEFLEKLSVVHQGIDTDSFKPQEDQKFKTDDLDLSDAKQLVTYTANVLAPYMGFQQFMESIPAVLKQKPETHIVIAGSDRVAVKDQSDNKKTYKSLILEKIELDLDRVHFLEGLKYDEYKMLLQSSSAHVYLDSPLVLSRSLLEAMASECLVIAPDIPPVKEVIKDGNNGIIADFSTPEKIAEKIIACLDYPSFMKEVKHKARKTIVEKYALKKVMPEHLNIIKKLVAKGKDQTQFG